MRIVLPMNNIIRAARNAHINNSAAHDRAARRAAGKAFDALFSAELATWVAIERRDAALPRGPEELVETALRGLRAKAAEARSRTIEASK